MLGIFIRMAHTYIWYCVHCDWGLFQHKCVEQNLNASIDVIMRTDINISIVYSECAVYINMTLTVIDLYTISSQVAT